MQSSLVMPVHLFEGGGDVRARMRMRDWTESSLGAPQDWPPALRTAVGLMLDSRFPMFVAWGEDLSVLYNDAYAEVLGRKHPEALGCRLADIWSEIWAEIAPLVERAMDGEATYSENMPLAMLRKGHVEQTWFTFSYSPLRDESGRVGGMFCACTETSAQILAERRQKFQLDLADRLRGLLEPSEITAVAAEALGRQLGVARVGYGEVDIRHGTIIVQRDWTSGTLSTLGGETRLLDGFGPDIIAQLRVGQTIVIDDVLRDRRSARHATGYASIEARALLVVPLIRERLFTAVLYLHHSEAHRWTDEEVALAEDVAERTWATVERARADARRRSAESALSAQLETERNRLRTLFQQAPGFMAVVRGPTHVFELANTAYMRLVGPRDILGKPIRKALPDLEGQAFFDQLDTVYESGQPFFANEAPVVMRPGPDLPVVERFVDFIYQPLTDSDGHVSGIFVEGYDVTERKLANRALRAANRRKDEFLAMLAHELRNPLAPISTAAQLLRMASHNPERVRQTSEIIGRQVEHMTGLVDDLLDVSRVTRGLIKLSPEPFDLHEAVAAAVEQTRALIEDRKHILTLRYHAEPAIVQGDRMRLVQIISNLLNNAAKYTPDGGHIILSITVEQEQVCLQVRDTGVGISPELLPHIFELFTQAERSPDRAQGGLGLGLALVASLAELHHGSITAHSAGPGQGSEFILRLPHAKIEPGPPMPFLETPAVANAVAAPLRVLVVDDNADAAESLALLLQVAGHEVSVASEARGALQRAQTEAPQVLLLDIGLPDMDGYDLARALRALPQTANAMLIALTGYGQEKDHARSRAAGFDHHLVKPADTVKLTALIAERAAKAC